MGKNQHVRKDKEDNKWGVKGEGNENYTTKFATQQEAIEAGREIAKNQQSELIIHNENGKIRAKHSYGNDPKNIKG